MATHGVHGPLDNGTYGKHGTSVPFIGPICYNGPIRLLDQACTLRSGMSARSCINPLAPAPFARPLGTHCVS